VDQNERPTSMATVQETAARLGLVTGKALATLIKERFPRPILVATVSLVVIANVFNMAADLMSMAASLQLLLPLPFHPLLFLPRHRDSAFELTMPYHSSARILRFLTISLVAYIAVLAIVDVNRIEIARSTLLPSLTIDRSTRWQR
jgi:Mn2+/Fe2+ NRAMP family transporter